MENLITDLNRNMGEKLIDAYNMCNDESVSIIHYTDVLSNLMYKRGITHALDTDLSIQ